MTRPRVKVCCIQTPDEARLAIAAGASALGLVASMPSGPGVISEAQIATIAARVPPPIATFLLTSAREADAILSQHERCRTNTLQLCDRIESATRERLRRALPGIALVQVVHVLDEESVREALEAAPGVDALLLDSGDPTGTTKELGGTGRTHDWTLSARIARDAPVPVFLAGGLRADNVAEAIDRVRPFGVDLCTGVRSDGALDAAKLRHFMTAVGAASTSRVS